MKRTQTVSAERILYKDEWLLIVNKLCGELAVAGSGRMDRLPLLDFLRKDYPELQPVHRLDFETSGVLVFARTPQVLDKILKSKFAGWTKRYRALVVGRPSKPKGIIAIPLQARSGQGTVDAKTEYAVLDSFGPVGYVEAVIERGQFHQIRRHFAAIKHPLVLDDEHGDKRFNKLFSGSFTYRKFFLHAISIDFPHPVTGKQMHIAAPLPRQFNDVLQKMKQRVEEMSEERGQQRRTSGGRTPRKKR
jgi:23S rRNA-/tRNA-specific pseudouridylate synthase